MPKHTPIRFETSFDPTLRKLLLQSMKESERAKTIVNATLAIAALGGAIALGALAPAVIAGFAELLTHTKKKQMRRYKELWASFQKLRSSRMLTFVREEGGYHIYRPSFLGGRRIRKMVYDELALSPPKRWDGQWRLVIFDVPKHFHKKRDAFRRKLQEMQFFQCQKSVWVHPFPCIEEVEFVKEMLGLKPYVKIFLVSEMSDGKVLYHFKNTLKDVV